ncbi:MAG: tRNA 2-thiouridine(34) synthase MnmA [Bacteroidaceae bacterium]|nr:tRNA 2-thiouridine(34) synthase MnmA [Bacteroidaceae bacterium]
MPTSVLVGMSGGIDSTAVCSMLLEKGYRVVGLTFVTCDASSASAEAAAALARKLGIEHYIDDVREEFRTKVVEPFIEGYLAGLTPNPCVNCNRVMKFDLLCRWADKLGCEKIATGHYVKLHEQAAEDGLPRYYIITGDDDKKDQSYFLWRLTQEQLSRCIFPLGGWQKSDVCRYLGVNNLDEAGKGGESMEVCFVPGDYRDFLRSNIPNVDEVIREGSFVDSRGRVLGTHRGYPYYTIGQRKGLGIALGHPAYVLKINAQKNTVMLGGVDELTTRYMLIDEPVWVDGVPQTGLSVRVRYRSAPIACDAPQSVGDGRFIVRMHGEASAITPGQSAVFYVGNTLVGGAYIASQRGINQWINE